MTDQPKRRGRPPGSKNKPKVIPVAVEEPTVTDRKFVCGWCMTGHCLPSENTLGCREVFSFGTCACFLRGHKKGKVRTGRRRKS